MHPVEIRPGIFWTGINDRSTTLFEGLWPIEHQGVSYNAYIIKDEKNALIDLSKENFNSDFLHQIASIINPTELDYIIVNHMEPDHSGAMLRLREVAPHAKILGMPKATQMVRDFYGITENVEAVASGQTLILGSHTLQFVFTPLVHWPETMVTYEQSQKVLFSCDAFGSYGALNGTIFDDTCTDINFYETEALRYYANIVAAFSKHVLSAIEKIKDVPIEVIAPSHGLVWHKNPMRILELYKQWATYSIQPARPIVTLLYGSMYRNTEHAMNYAAEAVVNAGVQVEIFDVGVTHTSYLLPPLWVNHGVLIAAPTYERKMFPPMATALNMALLKGVNKKIAGYFGSFAWSGGARAEFDSIAEQMAWDVLGRVEFVGSAKPDQIQAIVDLATAVAQKVKETA